MGRARGQQTFRGLGVAASTKYDTSVYCSRRLSLRLNCNMEFVLDEPHPEPAPEQKDAALTVAVKEVSGALAEVRSGEVQGISIQPS